MGVIQAKRRVSTPTQVSKPKYAFVAILWAPDGGLRQMWEYITDALVLGDSLRKQCDHIERILLITPCALKMPGANLLEFVWTVQVIDHVPVSSSRLAGSEIRFSRTFTKI